MEGVHRRVYGRRVTPDGSGTGGMNFTTEQRLVGSRDGTLRSRKETIRKEGRSGIVNSRLYNRVISTVTNMTRDRLKFEVLPSLKTDKTSDEIGFVGLVTTVPRPCLVMYQQLNCVRISDTSQSFSQTSSP